MVVVMKKFFIGIILLVSLFLFSGSVFAADIVCCCVDSDPYYYETLQANECSAISNSAAYSYNSTFAFIDCPLKCLPECSQKVCEGDNAGFPECICGSEVLTSPNFCCALSGDVYATPNLCLKDPSCKTINYFHVSGTVYDKDTNVIEGATITIGAKETQTRVVGRYDLLNIPEGSISITAKKIGCKEQTKSMFLESDFINANFLLDCSYEQQTCADVSGVCCNDGYECVNAEYVATSNCDACFLSCSSGCQKIVPKSQCSYGACDIADNNWCNETNSWVFFNLNDLSGWQTYCSNDYCGLVDPDCAAPQCYYDGCNGACPTGCNSPEDDPDCGLGLCDGSNNQWCDTVAGVWKGINDGFCNHCSDPDCPGACGNNVREGIEECDGSDSNSCLFGCTDQCTCEYHNDCGDMFVEFGEECDLSPCKQGYFCTSSCNCVLDDPCIAGFVKASILSTPTYTLDKTAVSISWNPPASCDITSFKIFRCKGVDCVRNWVLLGSTDSDDNNFVDETITPKINYGYYIRTYFMGGFYKDSNIKYIETGDEICLSGITGQFCYEDDEQEPGIYTCNDDNELELFRDADTGFCVDENGPRIVGTAECENCNSYYEMFVFDVLNTPTIKVIYENPFDDNPLEKSCSQLQLLSVCYLEKTLTSLDKFESCNLNSCYDYTTKDNCLDNPCNQFIKDGGYLCEWNNFNEELGLGVCVPQESEEQNCSLCDSENNIFSGCNEEICGLYGNCYYDNEANSYSTSEPNSFTPSCKHETEVKCRDYDTETDCVGNQALGVAVSYVSGERTSGNHEPTLSDDFFGFGKCRWDAIDKTCYRDADFNSPQFPNDERVMDCDSFSNLTCSKDFESPITTVFPEAKHGKKFVQEFFASDDVSTGDGIKTFYCIAENSCYPKTLATKTNFTHELFSESPNSEDSYNLFYYSKDAAENLEVVKSFPFKIDAKSPVVTITHTTNSYEIDEDDWYTDLNISLSFDENVSCNNINLTKPAGGHDNYENMSGREFSLFYGGLSDGWYVFNFDCADNFGNKPQITLPKIFKIEGDKRITNPLPYKTFNKTSNIIISIETVNIADCKYSSETPFYSEMTNSFVADNNKLKHSKTISVSGTGVYEYYTACQIQTQEGNEIVENNAGDKIMFAVDLLPPITTITETNSNQPMAFNDWYKKVDLKFDCVDRTYDTSSHKSLINNQGVDWSFGCKELRYCNGINCALEIESFPFETSFSVTGTYDIKFLSVDNGTNLEPVRSETIKIDNIVAQISFNVKDFDKNPVDTLGYGFFELTFNSNKDISEVQKLTYKVNSITKPIPIPSLPDEKDKKQVTANFEVSEAGFRDINTEIEFALTIKDTHGVVTQTSFIKQVDTTIPTAPTLEPIFSKTLSKEYPVHYFASATYGNGLTRTNTYYTNDNALFVTGITSQLELMNVLFYLTQNIYLEQIPITNYDQRATENIGGIELDETTIDGTANKGSFEISVVASQADLRSDPDWVVGNYLKFNNKRESYGNYHKFYEITEVLFSGQTFIRFKPALEHAVSGTVEVYEKDHDMNWFGKEIPLTYNNAGNNNYLFYASVKNQYGRPGSTATHNLFFDNQPPLIESDVIRGTIVDEFQPIKINISEYKSGSGINPNSIVISINNGSFVNNATVGNGLTFTYLKSDESSDYYRVVYTPTTAWKTGTYTLLFKLEDYANNQVMDNGFNTQACYNTKDGCCLNISDSTCDPDCRLVNGIYDLGEDPDCTNIGSCTTNSGDCCLSEPTDGICDADCFDNTWDSDCNCHHGECSANHEICQYGEWLEYGVSIDEDTYCEFSKCGREDPICFNCNSTFENTCDFENKVWCKNDDGAYYWVREGFNTVCGEMDSTCLDENIACEENACDSEEHMVCHNNYWISKTEATDYNSVCGRKDYLAGGTNAQEGDCDTSNNYYFDGSGWTLNNYCTYTSTKNFDSDCYESTCYDTTCNVDSETYCENNNWFSSDYENLCGSKDSTFGCPLCVEGICDVLNNAYCSNGVWVTSGYCDYNNCYQEDSECLVACLNTKDQCCLPVADGVCDKECTNAQNDPDCSECTSATGDCCVAIVDGVCDGDCNHLDPECVDEWVFDVDKDAPNNPIVNVIGVNEYNPDPHNRWNIKTTPQFILDYTKRTNETTENLNISITEIDITPNNANIICDTNAKNLFQCRFSNNLLEADYTINAVAQKMLPNGSFGSQGTYNFKLNIDATRPLFNLEVSPQYARSDQRITVTITNISNEQNHDLMMNMKVNDVERLINVSQGYTFFIPENYNWGAEGEKIVEFKVIDYAGNEKTLTKSIFIDNTIPEIIITEITSEGTILQINENLTAVSNRNVTLFGITSIDTTNLCYFANICNPPQSTCIRSCASSQSPCININGEFSLSPPICGLDLGESFNDIIITATDKARNYFNSTLYVLLDLQPPSPPNITIG